MGGLRETEARLRSWPTRGALRELGRERFTVPCKCCKWG